MAKLFKFTKTWVIVERAERRSDSEVLEPRCKDTLGRVERVMALGLVELRVKTRTLSCGFVMRAGEGVSVVILDSGNEGEGYPSRLASLELLLRQ